MSAEKIRAVVFDWAGTVVDYGSLAPMGVFVEAFAEFCSLLEADGLGGGGLGHECVVVDLFVCDER